MADASQSVFTKLSHQVFPRMPDIYGMIIDQCNLAVQAAGLLEEYVKSGKNSLADQIIQLEEDAEKVRDRNMEVLKNAFATPLDREDIYRAYTSVDCIIPFANTIISDMATLDIKADKCITDTVTMLRSSVEALRDGYQKLSTVPSEGEKGAEIVIKTRSAIEKECRLSTAKLFQADEYVKNLQGTEVDGGAKAQAVVHILEIFKRREIYRLITSAGNAMGNAGRILHDIVVQCF